MQSSRSYTTGHNDINDISHGLPGQQQQYYDAPARDIISPPPQYYSPAPPEPLSPVQVSYTQPYSTNDPRISIDRERDHSPDRYADQSPSPPPIPPPHRTSPSRYSRRNSGGRSIAGASIPMEDLGAPSIDARSRSQAPSERIYTQGAYERRSQQSGFVSNNPHVRNNIPPSPDPYLNRPTSHLYDHPSYGSNIPLAQGASTPGSITPTAASDMRSSRYSGRSIPINEWSSGHPYRTSHYHDSPYHNSSHNLDAAVSDANINPQNIADDGDDDFMPGGRSQMYSVNQRGKDGAGPTATVTAAGLSGGLLGGIFGRKIKNQTASGTYGPVDTTIEKTQWLAQETRKRKRNGWICGIVIGTVIILAIVAGIVGGVVSTRSYQAGGSSTNNANDDTATNGDLDINSPEIKQLLNNPNLHKVFPGIDYTPWGVQYPLCETYPPSQNNVTRDLAVLSQLTNTVRLYGTDCNQTQMVLHSLDRLKLTNMKVWLGVWIDTNQTTTDRQIAQMYSILSSVKDISVFKGAIIGNEALYRAGEDKAQSRAELIQMLKDVKSNFTSLGYNLPVATSDLGDNWDAGLVEVVDYVMSNIHPFFAGVSAEEAAAWTWDFWQNHDVSLTANLPNVKQIISETGWPSDGGTDCGGTDGDCAAGQSGSTASVANMNTYMSNWVCQALSNGTDYFWFEAFDEPWKVQFNTPGKDWEDKWGLMDSARNLKSGIKIPSCGGTTVS